MAGPALNSQARSAARDAASLWESSYKEIQNRARQAVDTSTELVNKHPTATVLGACAVGFVAGAILRSRR
ncbi:hypothetical protein [Bdellovibrio sp. HCB288]|uniref:hypothetical protein n=1 Tax=Bdellovibrio sp. HCB288 TaxID=3394355 RepID=UPI0039B63390